MKLKKEKQRSLFGAYIELTKPNILSLVLVSTVLGYCLGGMGIESWKTLIFTLLGTALTAGGGGALNHYLERDVDSLMERTKNRPIPAGLILPHRALFFGIFLVLTGSVLLVGMVNVLTGFLSLLTAFLYVLVYTPLKRLTWINTSIGAIPGALPVVGGWTAAVNEISTGAWIMFAIMYLWQHPHFYSIAWICKEDYARAGLKMLPVVEPDGVRTLRQIFWHLLLIIPVAILPFFSGMLGNIYVVGVTLLSLLFFLSAYPLARDKSRKGAVLLLKSSVFYLPLLLILIIIDLGLKL